MEEDRKNIAKKLDNLMENFGNFESEMKEETRNRREKEEYKINALKTEMSQLEGVLRTEVKKRVEMNKTLQAWCDVQVVTLKQDLESQLEAKTEKLQQSLHEMADRLTKLEDDFEAEKIRVTKDIEDRNRELALQLKAFQELFEEERASRLKREAEIVQRLATHEHYVQEQFQQIRSVRETKYLELREILQDNVRSRKKGDEAFHAIFHEEVALLKNQITEETKVREAEDDEIVDALNRYTKKLQGSLQILNSTKT